MPIEKYDDSLFREYDGLVGLTLLNIWSISKEKQIIRLCHFDRKNKEHLFILRVALMARDLYQYPVEVEGSWWDIFCLNWKMRKSFSKVKRYKPLIGENGEKLYAKDGFFPVPEMLELMRPDGLARCGENFSFTDIFKAYYEGSNF